VPCKLSVPSCSHLCKRTTYASELGVELGGEFRAAYRYWQQPCKGSTGPGSTGLGPESSSKSQPQSQHPHLIMGNRPLHLTLIRAWESLWWWPKFKVMAGLLWSSWQKPDKDKLIKWLESVRPEESDVLTESLNELRKHFPTLHTRVLLKNATLGWRPSWYRCAGLNIHESPLFAVELQSLVDKSRTHTVRIRSFALQHNPSMTSSEGR
jgi:hypothetical protein